MPIDIENDTLEVAMQKLVAREDGFKRLETISGLGSWELDLKTDVSHWSDRNYEIMGIKKGSITPNLERFLSLVVPQDLEATKKTLQKAIQTGENTSYKCRIQRPDGETRNLLIKGLTIYDDDGTPSKVLGTSQDITDQIQLKHNSHDLQKLIEFSPKEIYIVNYETLEYMYVNKGVTQALGYSKRELLKLNIYDINKELTSSVVNMMKKSASSQHNVTHRSVHTKKDGTTYNVQAYIHKLNYQGKKAFVIFDSNIDSLIVSENLLIEQAQKLTYQANHDSLTQLPNRMLFQDRLAEVINSSMRNEEEFAVLFLDLDQFKKINDTLGHNIGDKVLVQVAKGLKSILHEDDTLARLGGDEFTIILKDIKSRQDAIDISQKIIEMFKEPLDITRHDIFISSSIGISLFPQDASTAENLIKYADTAMYKAKDEGRDNFQFYSADMTLLAFEKVVMENALRIAIKEDQFIVHYQAQFSADGKQIVGMEALVRWEHPNLGLISPAKFIPIAEDSGLIVEIDTMVMEKSMQEFEKWYKAGYNPGILALNLAMKQLNNSNFIPMLLAKIKKYNFNPAWLALEVTEGQIMNNPEVSISKLNKIHSLGIEIALDDFGTGYSSLSYLKKLPLDKLKIDQSFISDIPEDEDDVAITKAIIALGQCLNLKIVAEGVETQEQRDFIVENGCEYIQGYFYSRPLPYDKVTKLLQDFS